MKIVIELSINVDAKVVTEDNKNEIILVPIVEIDQDQEVPSTSTSTSTSTKELVQEPKTSTTSSNGHLVTCRSDDCEDLAARRGYCDKHYMEKYQKLRAISASTDDCGAVERPSRCGL